MTCFWSLFAPRVADRSAVGLAYEHGEHCGFLDWLRVNRDGSCEVRFEDATTITIPALKENL